MASKEPCAGHAPDPQDFYAADSLVLDEYPDPSHDSNESEPEVQDDDQIKSSTTYHV
jgi:hypothetical protein